MEQDIISIDIYKTIQSEIVDSISTEKLEEFQNFISKHNGIKIVITHSGSFHADEVLGVLLVKFIKEFDKFVLVRTRNKSIWSYANLIMDVGGEFDPEKYKYDHHMDFFKETFSNDHKIKLSSAGLIYKYHGKEILQNLLNVWKIEFNERNFNLLYNKVYKSFIEYVDGNDNGINQFDGPKNYHHHTDYASRVSRMNPNSVNRGNQTDQFLKSISIAEEEFIATVSNITFNHIPSYSIVYESIEKRNENHESGQIIVLSKGCQFKEHLINIEIELKIENLVKFVISQFSEFDFRVHTVPKDLGSFEFRKGLCKNWRGKELDELKNLSKIDDIIFCHPTGFIGGAKSLNSALLMAKLSLEDE